MKSVVLLSGGLDSAVCLFREVGFYDTYALTVSYGQSHSVELEAAAVLAKEAGVIEHVIVEAGFDHIEARLLSDEDGQIEPREPEKVTGISPMYVPARNTVLLALAMSWADSLGAERIIIGCNKDDVATFPDCRPKFIEGMNAVSQTGTRVRPEIIAPLIEKSKEGVAMEAVRLRIDIAETVSCYWPHKRHCLKHAGMEVWHCGRCAACVLRRAAFSKVDDPTRYLVSG